MKRIISSLIAVPFILWSIAGPVGSRELSTILIIVCAVWALHELNSLGKKAGRDIVKTPLYVGAALLIIAPYLRSLSIPDQGFWNGASMGVYTEWGAGFSFATGYHMDFFALLLIGIIAVARQIQKGISGAFSNLAFTSLVVLYIIGPMYSLACLRATPVGPMIILWVFLTTIFNDAGAYYVGSSLGKHKMSPVLSPKKTWEGFIGGIVVANVIVLIVGIVLLAVGRIFADVSLFYWGPPSWPTVLQVIGATIILCVVGVIGDLAESLIKRDIGVKDSGTSFPGHGGILDAIDALLFTIPTAHFLSSWVF